MYTARPLWDHHCIPIFNLHDHLYVMSMLILAQYLSISWNMEQMLLKQLCQGHDLYWTLAFKTTLPWQKWASNVNQIRLWKQLQRQGDFSQLKTNQRLSGSVVSDIYWVSNCSEREDLLQNVYTWTGQTHQGAVEQNFTLPAQCKSICNSKHPSFP